MANIIDRLVGVFSPEAGLRRHRSRQLLQRAYEGANKKDGWNPRRPGASANTDHRADAGELRKRARSLVQNSPYVSRGIGSLVANTIGTGIMPRSLTPDGQVIDKLHSDWAKVCDADGRLDLYGLQAAAYRAMEQDGEVLLRLRPRRQSDSLPVPLQLQLLEIDWLDTAKTGTAGPNTIINGIEYDPLGRVANYWLWDQHPGEQLAIYRRRSSSNPVPAANIVHLYNPERPGQGRGITRLAPIIARVRDLTLYEDAELQRKNLETRLSVLVSGDAAYMSQSESQAVESVKSTGELGTLSSGSIVQLPTGNNITTLEPKAAPGYVDYVKFNLHLVAVGMGVTYEMLTGDVSDTNFSSARVNILEFRRNAEQTQWLTFIPKFAEPIWRAFIDAGVLGGQIRQPDYSVAWSTPRWEYVNPEQDVKADLAEISGGLCSISSKIRERGEDPELVFAEIKKDLDRLRADGTLDVLLQLQTNQAPQANQGAAPAAKRGQAGAAGNAQDDTPTPLQRALEQAHADNRSLHTTLSALLARSASTEPVQNHIHLNPTPVEVRNEVNTPAPTVNVNNQVNPTPVEVRNEVNVPAPEVTVQNNVQPATVDVNVRATMPPRLTEDTLLRDTKGVITGKRTIERDI